MHRIKKAKADYQMALTKQKPPLNPWKRERALARVRELPPVIIQ
jgi:hypothetical protein